MHDDLRRRLAELPLVAILRGLRPEEAVVVGDALVEAGFRIIEVPLNSPEPFASIRLLVERFGERALVGAGTVTDPAEVTRLRDAGGGLVVMPHGDVEVIRAAKAAGLACVPGVATPTEAFAALKAGADALKLFPAGMGALPVGGITPENMAAWRVAGAAGFGLGSALYRPGATAADVARQARRFVDAWRSPPDPSP